MADNLIVNGDFSGGHILPWTFVGGGDAWYNEGAMWIYNPYGPPESMWSNRGSTGADTSGNYEFGEEFTPIVNGVVTELRFYRTSAATVTTRKLNLWHNGILIAQVSTTNESGVGWKGVILPTPVRLTAGEIYIVSYNSNMDGSYAVIDPDVAPSLTSLRHLYGWNFNEPPFILTGGSGVGTVCILADVKFQGDVAGTIVSQTVTTGAKGTYKLDCRLATQDNPNPMAMRIRCLPELDVQVMPALAGQAYSYSIDLPADAVRTVDFVVGGFGVSYSIVVDDVRLALSAESERYTDPFLNSLMTGHQATARGELHYADAKVADILFTAGTVTAARGGTVRRTFSGSLDPNLMPVEFGDKLSPYGTQLTVYKGIRFANGTVEEYPVFTGRIDSVDFGHMAVNIQASDRGADIVDARFLSPRQSTLYRYIPVMIADLIEDVFPDVEVIDLVPPIESESGEDGYIMTYATWDRERTEALDNLAQSIGAEWYAGPDGKFYIAPLPSIVVNPIVTWIIDSGDRGVAIERSNQTDRARIYNAVIVNGEPPDGRPPAYGAALDDDPDSPLYFGGPFGKVPKFFSSQFIYTNAQATDVAVSMLGDCVCGTRAVTVTCVPNARLNLGDIVEIRTGSGDFDGLYFINSFTLPLEPETPMTLACNVTLVEEGDFLRRVKRGVTP